MLGIILYDSSSKSSLLTKAILTSKEAFRWHTDIGFRGTEAHMETFLEPLSLLEVRRKSLAGGGETESTF